MNCYPPYLSNVEDASVAFCQPLKDYYFDLFKFAVSVNLKKLNLVCNLNGETGLSTFCANGTEANKMPDGHSPFIQQSKEPRTISA